MAHAPYHEVDTAETTLDDPGRSRCSARALSSPFFTADVARLAAGGLTVIEVNDGGSFTFPEQLDPWDFYRAIINA